MQGGIAQVWTKNKTNAVLSHTFMFSHLMGLLACIERMGHSQLHTLKMMTGMMADEYTAKFKM